MDKTERYGRGSEPDPLRADPLAMDAPSAPAPEKPSANPATDLLKTIESEILPRLMLVHTGASTRPSDVTETLATIGPEEVAHFSWLMTDQSVSSGQEFIDALMLDGFTLEQIYLELMAPAARRLGEFWETDTRTFTDVTLGLCRLHELLRYNTITPAHRQFFLGSGAPTVLLATACEDQHVFGILMVAEFFRKEGWHVRSEPGASTEELARIVSTQSYDVIGLSIARSITPNRLSDVVQTVRKASKNKATKILLGGALIQRDESIAQKVGADGACTDAALAPGAAKSLLADTRIGC